MLDYYDTAVLLALVKTLKRPNTGLLTLFFPMVSTSTAEKILFEIENGRRRLAPFVSPKKAGKVIESQGSEMHEFKPAYVKDKRVFDPDKPFMRLAGESIGGSENLTPEDRYQLNVIREMADQVEMLTNRLEVMAAELLLTGKVTVTGEGFQTMVVDFGRRAELTLALAPGSQWGDADVSPIDDIDDWCEEVDGVVKDVIFDKAAWRLYKADPKFEKVFNSRKSDDQAQIDTVLKGAKDMEYKGTDGARRIWVCTEEYYDSETEMETKVVPEHTVILGGDDFLGCRHFGAIKDKKAGFQAVEYFPKMWENEDPAVEYLMMQSAPMVAGYRPNASMAITVR